MTHWFEPRPEFRLGLAHAFRDRTNLAVVACVDDDDAIGFTQLVAFDLNEGGVLCRSCRSGQSISPGALDLLRNILGGRLAYALAQEESSITHEVSGLATRALEFHIERRLKAIAMFEAH